MDWGRSIHVPAKQLVTISLLLFTSDPGCLGHQALFMRVENLLVADPALFSYLAWLISADCNHIDACIYQTSVCASLDLWRRLCLAVSREVENAARPYRTKWSHTLKDICHDGLWLPLEIIFFQLKTANNQNKQGYNKSSTEHGWAWAHKSAHWKWLIKRQALHTKGVASGGQITNKMPQKHTHKHPISPISAQLPSTSTGWHHAPGIS